MYRVKSTKPDSNNAITLSAIAEKFRSNIWTMMESWTRRIANEKGVRCRQDISKTNLIDSMPTLLTGIAKTIEYPDSFADFEPGGVINNAAVEFGTNRRLIGHELSDILIELEMLRNVVWSFCRKNLKAFDLLELEYRISKSLDKITSTITESYIKAYVDEIAYTSRHDKTTGFLTHDLFTETLDNEIRRSKRYRHPCSLILLEIDDFNKYRNTHGRIASDDMVRIVSTTISKVIRSVDVPIRYDSGALAIILPETSLKNARKVAERLRRAIKQDTRHESNVRDILKSTITISAGISTCSKDIATVDKLEFAAKKLLTNAKNTGDIIS